MGAANGSFATTAADGVLATTAADGIRATAAANGSFATTAADGVRATTAAANSSFATTAADGVLATAAANGIYARFHSTSNRELLAARASSLRRPGLSSPFGIARFSFVLKLRIYAQQDTDVKNICTTRKWKLKTEASCPN